MWDYQSGQTLLAGTAFREALGGDPVEQIGQVRERLFETLGVRTAIIELDQAGNLVWSSYMFASASDRARLGQLYVDGGILSLKAGWPMCRTPAGLLTRGSD